MEDAKMITVEQTGLILTYVPVCWVIFVSHLHHLFKGVATGRHILGQLVDDFTYFSVLWRKD
jgi:hypothetical protein